MLDLAKGILKVEAEAILSLVGRLDKRFEQAVELILNCKGNLIISGMGKAGLVGQKLSATFASTGTPSFFLHPTEALHGDLGRVCPDDVVLILSNSGETREVLDLLPHLKRSGAKIISITSSSDSTLGRHSNIVIETGDIQEACPLGLAPSASSTAIMALGDALAFAVFTRRGFDKEQFARYHPAGEIGKKFMKVREIMRTGERNPIVYEDTPVVDALMCITKARAGAVTVVDKDGKIAGIFTDGDLRRSIEKKTDIFNRKIKDVMTKTPVTIDMECLAVEAARILKEKKIDEMPVVDKEQRPVGMLDVQDLLDIGII